MSLPSQSPGHLAHCEQAIADRREAIAKVMADMDMRRLRLAAWIRSGSVDNVDASRRNTRLPGVLGQRWSEFIQLPPAAQLEALSYPHFNGTSWQALLQSTPYFEVHHEAGR